ncbi:MAG: hypothetical protein ABR529_15730 [Actinomycetota bacterium]
MGRRLNLTEAASVADRHRNTIRGWVLAGRLESAKKEITDTGTEIWTLDEDELYDKNLIRAPQEETPLDLPSPPALAPDAVVRPLIEALADAERRAAIASVRLEDERQRREQVEEELRQLRKPEP